MKNPWNWIIGIGLVLILELLLILGLGVFGLWAAPMTWMNGGTDVWRFTNWNHHGLRWGVPMMGLFGGLLMLALLAGLLVLTVLGIVFLVRALQMPTQHSYAHPSALQPLR